MKQRKRIVGYRLSDGERREWRSMTECGASVGCPPQSVSVGVRERRPVHGWCLSTNEDTAIAMYEGGGRCGDEGDRRKKVPLRIDSHTTIYVKPSEATEEFAAAYRKRLEKGLRYDD